MNHDALRTPPTGSGNLTLDAGMRTTLIVITFFGVLSFLAASFLFLQITYRLIQWDRHSKKAAQQITEHETVVTIDLSLGLAQRHFNPSNRKPRTASADPGSDVTTGSRRAGLHDSRKPNPLLILIYMLLMADIVQSISLMLNIVHLRRGAIIVHTDACWAQGWLRSSGDLTASLFVAAISINTYLAIVRVYRMSPRVLWLTIAAIWSFVNLIITAGVLAANDGKVQGEYWARADIWCWISVQYKDYRLWTHYVWVVFAMVLTMAFYILLIVSIYCANGFSARFSVRRPKQGASGFHAVFLIYPLIYLTCTAPLALGRFFITVSGISYNEAYFRVAGAMIASNGWLDAALWGTTIMFLGPEDIKATGLEHFGFMRTPHGRQYGNMVWVQGGAKEGSRSHRGWWPLWDKSDKCVLTGKIKKMARPSSRYPGSGIGISQESMERSAKISIAETGIQLETVTTVVVE